MSESSIETELALIRRDIAEIKGDLLETKAAAVLMHAKLERLDRFADRGTQSLRVALWMGGGIVAAAAAIVNLKNAVSGLFH
jgi:hypothetical protein